MSFLYAASLMIAGQAQLPEWQMISLRRTGETVDSLVFVDRASLKREGSMARATIFFVGEKNATRMLYEFDCAGNRSHALTLHDADAQKDVVVGEIGEWKSLAGRTGGPLFDMQRYACEGVRSDAQVMKLATPVNLARVFFATMKQQPKK